MAQLLNSGGNPSNLNSCEILITGQTYPSYQMYPRICLAGHTSRPNDGDLLDVHTAVILVCGNLHIAQY